MPDGPWTKYQQPDIRTGSTASGSVNYAAQGVSNPPNGGQVADIANPEPNDGPWAKYAQAQAPPHPAMGTISAAPGSMPGDSMASKVENWARNVQHDLKYGTDTTGVGHVLKALGAHGLYSGNSEGVGDFMGSLPLGLAKMVQGGGEAGQGKILQGAKDVGGGALQAATIPASFAVPEAAEVAPRVAEKAVDLMPIPTARKAGRLFQEVMTAAQGKPISLTRTQPALERVAQLTDAGGPVMTAPNKLLLRSQTVNPIPYEEARDFYSNISNLSAADKLAANRPMKRAVGELREAFKQDIGDTAASAGKGAEYDKAMRMYHQAARNKEAAKTVGKYVIAPAIGIPAGYSALDYLLKLLK